MFQATVYRLLVGGSGSTKEERQLAQEVIANWNQRNSEDSKMILLPMTWESATLPIHGKRPQATINEQLVVDCDAMVAFFRDRLGTPTGVSISGTVEEVDEVHSAGSPVAIYCYTGDISQETAKSADFIRLQDFIESIKDKTYYASYKDMEDLRSQLEGHIDLLSKKLNAVRQSEEEADKTDSSESQSPGTETSNEFAVLRTENLGSTFQENEYWDTHFGDVLNWNEENQERLTQYLLALFEQDASLVSNRADIIVGSADLPEPSRQQAALFLAWSHLSRGSESLAESTISSVLEKPSTDKIAVSAHLVMAETIKAREGSHSACDYLENALNKSWNDAQKASLLKRLSALKKDNSEDWQSQLFAESAFQSDPDDTSLKFDLAYKYSEMNLKPATIKHYRELLRANPKHFTALNNLAVALDGYEIEDVRIKHLESAAKMGNALAYANLASEYIDGGFLADADRMLMESRKCGKESWAANQESRLESLKHSQDDRYMKLLSRFEETNRHLYHASCALTDRNSFEPQSTWMTDEGIEAYLQLNNLEVTLSWEDSTRTYELNGTVKNRLLNVHNIKWISKLEHAYQTTGATVTDSIGYFSTNLNELFVLEAKGAEPQWLRLIAC